MYEAEFDRVADEYYEQHAASIRLSGEAPEYFHRYKVLDVAEELSAAGVVANKILDFGAGVGNSLGPMLDAFPQAGIVLLDPSAKSLEIARSRSSSTRAEFRHFDGRRIPFADETFDVVFAACVFHHIDEELQVPLLAEIRRVMARRASLFVFEHNPRNPLTRKAVRDCPFDENAVLIPAEQLSSRLGAAGFSAHSISFRIFFPHFLKSLRRFERFLRGVPFGAQYYAHAIKY